MADATRLFLPRLAVGHRSASIVRTRCSRSTAGDAEPDPIRRLISEINGTGCRHFVFPIHPRTRRVLEEHEIPLAPCVHVTEPLSYLEMLDLVARSTRVVTDSGGMQKEAYWLRIPCITLRPSTEWIDTVGVGANTLIDPTDPSGLGVALANAEFPDGAPPLYGDGHASERVAEALLASLPASHD